MEEPFGCADEGEEVACSDDCCLSCITLNNMNSPSEAVLPSPVLPQAMKMAFIDFHLHSDPLLSGIERPPIASHV